MNILQDFKINLRRKWKSLVFLINLGLFLALGLSFLQPFLYKSNFSILIIQDQKDATTDVYSSIKSADKLGILLTRVIKTSDFYNSVMGSEFNLSKDDFSSIESKKRSQWENMVDVKLIKDSGILDFNVYYKNKTGAEEYAKAISSTLINDGPKFYGTTDIIKFRILNPPLTTTRPAKPDMIVNSLLGLSIGFLIGMFYVILSIPVKKPVKYTDLEFYEEEKEEPRAKSQEPIIENREKKIQNSEQGEDRREEIQNREQRTESRESFTKQVAEENSDSVEEVGEKEVEAGFLKNLNSRVKNILPNHDIDKK